MKSPTIQELRAAAKVMRWLADKATENRGWYPPGFRWVYDISNITPNTLLQKSALLESMADDLQVSHSLTTTQQPNQTKQNE